MDAVARLLDGPRAHGAFLLRSTLDPPWSLRIEDRAPLTVVAPVRGTGWVVPDEGGPVALAPGDLALLRGPAPYTVADAPGTPPQAVIHPGQRCTAPDGSPLAGMGPTGVRSWGNSPDGATVLLTGTYPVAGEVGRRILAALPAVVVLGHAELDSPLLDLLAEEMRDDRPGQDAVLDRLLDLLLITALRAWLARPDAGAPGWYRAQGDPVVGPALRLLHERPAEPWTVAALADRVGVSRATLARRFRDLVGEGPMAYLAGWRTALAADLLREPGATVGSVAREVGYGTPFALSTAFRRLRGESPRDHRRRVRAAGPSTGD